MVSASARCTATRVAFACRATLVSSSWKMRKSAVLRSRSGSVNPAAMSTTQRIPVRRENSRPCHSMAAASPISSSTSGRRPEAMRRTEWMMRSICWQSPFVASVMASGPAASGVLASELMSNLSPVSAWPSSSWISRAMWMRSSSRIDCRRAARARRFSSDARSRCSERLRSSSSAERIRFMSCRPMNTASFERMISGITGFSM